MSKKYPPLPNLDNADLRLLRVFMAVVRNRGFSAAQAELNINQPTISVQMSQLEGRLRMRLCHRGRSGFKLTQEGEFVYEATQRMFASIEQFRSDIASSRGELTGELHIGVVDAVATNDNLKLHQTIRSFNESAKAVDLRVHIRSPQMLLRNLLEERIHIGIAPFSSVPQSIKLVKLHKETQVLYCSSSHELFDIKDNELTIDAIAEFPYAARNYLQNWSPPETSQFRTAASTGDMEAMLLYILSGRFIGYLPEHYAEPWVKSGKIKSLLKSSLSYKSQFFLASRNDEKNIVVLDFIEQFMQDIVQTRKSLKSVKSA